MSLLSALAVAAVVGLLVPGCSARRLVPVPRAPERRASVEGARSVVAVVAMAALSVAVLGPGVGLVLAGANVLVGRRLRSSAEPAAVRRRRARVRAQLPTALDLLVAALESGQPPTSALELVAGAIEGPLADDLAAVAARLKVAADPWDVWDELARDSALGSVGRAFRRAETSGVPVARVVAEVATEIRREHHAVRRDRGRRVAVRTAAPLGLCFLPAFFLVGIVPTVVGVFSNLDLGL